MSGTEWRFDAALDMESGRSVYWLMAGGRTLGKLYGRRTAQQIVAAHNRKSAVPPVDAVVDQGSDTR